MDIIELKGIFEYELKRKLAQRSLSPIEELRKLIGALKFYDYSNSMVLNKDQWIRGVLRTGLCGFNISDLANVFDLYDPNKTGNINYLNFARYLYGKEQFKPIVSQSQENNNIGNNNNIQKNIDIDKSKFVPPGQYERNVEENDLENIVNRPELKINNPNINENKNINIDDSTIGKRRNYHITKSQSQMLPPKTNNNINQKEEQNENKIVQNLEQDNNNIKQGKENKNFFKSLVDFLRPKININNGVTYYSLAHHLKSNEDAATKTTSLESLLSTIKLLQLDINPDDIINLYACLDYTQTGKVSTDEILRIISGDIDEKRKISIISKFAEMDKNKTGYLPISLIKTVFNAKFHPDCFLGKKPENEVQDEFMFTFEVFCFLKGLGNDQEISFRDFVEYYTPISASIENDNYFDDILLGSWNIEDENILPKKENEININNNAQINQNIPNEIIENNNLKIDQRNRFQIAQTPNINDITSNSQNIMPNRNLPEEKKYGKIKYNPITNEFRTLENYSNTRNNNNNIGNKKNINFTPMNISEIPSLIKLKNALIKRGMKSIFIIQRMLYMYDKNQTGEIPFNKFCEIFEIYNINISREEIFEFFEAIDKEHKGIIRYNDFITILINDINPDRKILIRNLFDKLKKGINYILVDDIKKYFNPDRHPDVIEKVKTRDELAFEFFDSLEIFKEYNINLLNENIIKGIMTYNEFENYFKEISLSIIDDKLFDYIINFCWEIDNKYNNNGNQNGYTNDNVRIRTGQQIINNKNY